MYSMFVTGTGAACLMDTVQYGLDEAPPAAAAGTPRHQRSDLPPSSAAVSSEAPALSRPTPNPLSRETHPRLTEPEPSDTATRALLGSTGCLFSRRAQQHVLPLRGTTPTTPAPRSGAWSFLPIPSTSRVAGSWNL